MPIVIGRNRLFGESIEKQFFAKKGNIFPEYYCKGCQKYTPRLSKKIEIINY